jgi:autotransporter-associated beta strand protein
MLFDGQTTGPVSATSNGGGQVGSSVGYAEAGLWVHLTANQVSPVTFHTTVANSASQGIRFNSITIDAGAGSFTLGKNSTTNCMDTLWGTSNPSGQGLTNNSVNPAYILPDVRWRLGAGGAHTFTFGGTGDWHVTNDIANVNGSASLIAKDGPGTLYWTAGHNSYWGTITTISTPMTLSGGTLVLQSSSLFPATTTINTTAGALLKLDVVGGSQTIANPVNGGGNVQVNNGTLTLSGQNTYTGDTILSGGSLVANRAENLGVNGPLGVGGFISFTGGTLVFSSANNFDYSPRFTNSAGQSFRFDTAGQNVTFTNVLASTGGTLTKLGSGSLTLSGANTYDGATTVSAGKLVIQGSQGLGAITVSNSAALGANQGGQQIKPSVLTVGTSASATLEFNNVNNATTPAIVAGTLAAGGTMTVNIGS